MPFKATKKLSFGWTAKNLFAVDRNSRLSPDQRYDTFNLLTPGSKGANWEIAVPNGVYQVHIVAGDPTETGTYRIKAEKTVVIDGKATGKKRWLEGIFSILPLAIAPSSARAISSCQKPCRAYSA